MVIAMLTLKPSVLAAIAVLLLVPEAALAQARSSTSSAPSLAAPRVSAPTTTRASPSSTTPAAPSTSLSPTPSAGLTPPGGVSTSTTPTAQPGLSPMSDPLPSQFATSGGGSPNLALSPGNSG